jgi:carboxymethylenebutenolidase
VSKTNVIEETILSFAHNEELTWLLPGVKPTKKFVSIPIVDEK